MCFFKLKNPTHFLDLCNITTQNIISGNWFAKGVLNSICTCFTPCTYHIQARSVTFTAHGSVTSGMHTQYC